MREDMFKVIVERPRLVNSNGYSRDGRRFRNREDTPNKLGMKQGYNWTKYLNENLAPLKRYLGKQVNRPWDKVYSEICATIDSRNTVKQHILQHIGNFVERDTYWVETPKGGKVVIRGGGWPNKADVPLEESRCELYVHPRTGILLRNRRYVSYDAKRRKERQATREKESINRREIDEHTQLHRVDGIWYEAQLAELPMPKPVIHEVNGKWMKTIVYPQCWDVVRKGWVSRERAAGQPRIRGLSTSGMYGDPGKYAVSKRQLNSRELKKYDLSR